MKKCILIVNWRKWLQKKRPEIRQSLTQAYEGHYSNLFLWNQELESYLKEQDIEYHINISDYKFKNSSRKK